jgi:hypothetical protein
MWPRARGVSVDNGSMTLEAAMSLVAVSVLVWVMIVLPIVLLLGIGIAYLMGRRRTPDEIRTARDAGQADAAGPDDVERGPPGGVTT